MIDNLENLTSEELDRVKKMLDIVKMQHDIERLNAETTKLQKETKYYPLILATGFGTAFGGILVALLAKLF